MSIEKKIDYIKKQLGDNDPNEVLGEVYLHTLSLLAEIELLKKANELLINCENCRHKPCDHNSECDSCQSYSRWQSNFEIITK